MCVLLSAWGHTTDSKKYNRDRWCSANIFHDTSAWGTLAALGIPYRTGGPNKRRISLIASEILIQHILGQSLLLIPEGEPWFLCKYPLKARHAVCGHFFLWNCRVFSIYLMKSLYAYYLAMLIAKQYYLASNINVLLFYYMLLIILCIAASLWAPL